MIFSSSILRKFVFQYSSTSTISFDHKFNVTNFGNHLKKCAQSSNLHVGTIIHAHILKIPLLQSSIFLQNSLLNMYFKCSPNLYCAQTLFDEMPLKNIVTWSASIAGLVQHNHPKKALILFIRMQTENILPNQFTIVSALHASSHIHDVHIARHVYTQVVKLGYESNVFLTNAYLMGLIRNRRFKEGVELFEKCMNRDIVSYNTMMACYLDFECFDIWNFWCQMMSEDVVPDEFSFSSMLTGLARTSSSLIKGVQIHAQVTKYGYYDDTCVMNSIVDLYLKNHDLDCGFRVFDDMRVRDVVSWTQMAAGCLDYGQPLKALEIIRRMELVGVRPNKFTLATVFSACSSLSCLEEGVKRHGLRVKLGKDIVDVCVDNSLIDMYAKCGSMKDATKVFKSMRNKCNVTWTTVIKGYAQNGNVQEALDVFNEMISCNVEPNSITFICVLYACSQGGHVDEGWKHFASMMSTYNICPTEDHYACMVDLLGKAGHVREAEALLLSMDFKPTALLWQMLLSACRLHGEVEIGKRAAERAFALEKNDPSTYVLLSNMYADRRIWDGVDKVRELMGNRELKKLPGSSWIENMKGHDFFTVHQHSS